MRKEERAAREFLAENKTTLQIELDYKKHAKEMQEQFAREKHQELENLKEICEKERL